MKPQIGANGRSFFMVDTTFQNEGGVFGAVGGSGLVRCGSLLSLSLNNEEERKAKTARNRRYKLLRELSRNVWNTKLPMHQARHCSQRYPVYGEKF